MSAILYSYKKISEKICNLSEKLSKSFWNSWSELWIFTSSYVTS